MKIARIYSDSCPPSLHYVEDDEVDAFIEKIETWRTVEIYSLERTREACELIECAACGNFSVEGSTECEACGQPLVVVRIANHNPRRRTNNETYRSIPTA